MKNLSIFIALIGLLTLSGCSSVKVVDAWKAPNARDFRDNNFLVVARTNVMQNRIAFESEMVAEMEARGLKATASFSRFPGYKPKADSNEEREKLIREILDNEGYNGIVVISVKDVTERTTTNYSGGYYGGPYNSYYPAYYGGFYGYYYRPYTYTYGVSVGTGTSTTTTSKTYYVETVVYNLERDRQDQLIAVVTTSIEDPSDAYKTASKYAEEVVTALENIKN